MADLPSSTTRRWGLLAKARVVAGVEGGLITLLEACARYDMSIDEYQTWKRLTIRRNYPHLGWIKSTQVSKASS
jgi:hypothetical protein